VEERYQYRLEGSTSTRGERVAPEGGGSTNTTAIIWDFDGTLVDTLEKNLNVTRRIVAEMTGDPFGRHPMLETLESYRAAVGRAENWRSLYRRELGFDDDEIDRAGSLWGPYQLADETPVALFDGIAELVGGLGHLAQGVVSQNSLRYITEVLATARLGDYFRHIVGYEEVPAARQKPAPDGLLACLEALTGLAPGRVFYVGDHDTDIRCAVAAQAELDRRSAAVEVVAVGVEFGGYRTEWSVAPHHAVRAPGELLEVIQTG